MTPIIWVRLGQNDMKWRLLHLLPIFMRNESSNLSGSWVLSIGEYNSWKKLHVTDLSEPDIL